MCNMSITNIINNNKFLAAGIAVSNKSYVRTPEDEAHERADRAWKKARNDDAVKQFLVRNPSGRIIPKI